MTTGQVRQDKIKWSEDGASWREVILNCKEIQNVLSWALLRLDLSIPRPVSQERACCNCKSLKWGDLLSCFFVCMWQKSSVLAHVFPDVLVSGVHVSCEGATSPARGSSTRRSAGLGLGWGCAAAAKHPGKSRFLPRRSTPPPSLPSQSHSCSPERGEEERERGGEKESERDRGPVLDAVLFFEHKYKTMCSHNL